MLDVKIRIKRGELTIKPSSDDQLHVESDPPLIPELQGSTAVIDAQSISRSVHATIFVPVPMGSLDASIGLGPCVISSLSIKDADLDLGLGSLTVESSQGEWDADLGKGDATFTNVRGPMDIDTGMGRLTLRHVQGRAEVNSGLGPVEVFESQGHFKLSAGKGNILWQSVKGSGTIHAGMGTVTITDSQGAKLEIKSGLGQARVTNGSWEKVTVDTGVGDIRVDGSISHLEASAKQRGHIHVSLSEPLDARIEASTERGRIISSLNLMPVGHAGPQRGERVVGVLGEGTGEVKIHTRRGDITLDGTSLPKAPAPQEADERLAILQELQQGTLSVDEADALLSALGPTPSV